MRRTSGALLVAILIGGCAAPATPTRAPAVTPAPTPTAARSAQPTATATPTPTPSSSATPVDARTAGYQSDLQKLIDVREQFHPEPWHGIARQDYVAAVEAVAARIPELTDNEMMVELTRLAALPALAGRDGHGGIFAWAEGRHHMYPLRLYWFSDGLFVVDAFEPHTELIGLRIDAINGHAAEDVLDAVDPLTSRDNYSQVLVHGPLLAGTAEVLQGLGLIEDALAAVPFTFESASGEMQTELVDPVSMNAYFGFAGGMHLHSPPPSPDGPLWLTNFQDDAWFEVDEQSRTLFLGYNMTDEGVFGLIGDMQNVIASGDVDRFVVDVRHNGGGDNTTYGTVMNVINQATEELSDGAYVVMGRGTFSAAGNFVTDVEDSTDAVLVGEDSGGSPNQWGDGHMEVLTHSGLTLYVALQWIVRSDPDDPRLTVEPDIATPLSAADYFAGIDPAMEAILADAS